MRDVRVSGDSASGGHGAVRPDDGRDLVALSEETVAALAGRVRGSVVAPDHPGFDEARQLWNGMIDRRPSLIVRCAGAADVRLAVDFAREHRLPVSVRGGGHNVSGSAVVEGGLVVDLSEMRSVRVDPARAVVRVEGGATLGDLDHETQSFGLAVPVGVVSATGIGGLSLHGGIGFLTRKYGLTSDNLVAADVVAADGELHHTDETHEPDLLWALRGGGGVGVVTSFEFRAHPVGPEVWLGFVMYPAADAPLILPAFRSLMATAPDELMGVALYWSAPEEDPFPPEHHGAPVIVLVGCWCGPIDEGERAIQPLRDLGTPVVDLSGKFLYVEAQRLFDPDYPSGQRYYWKSTYLPHLDDDVIAVLDEYAASRPSPLSTIDVWALGGAFGRVPPETTAFFRRQDPFLLGIEANWTDPADDEANLRWVRDLFKEVQRFSDGAAYFNFPGFVEEGETQLRLSFGSNFERLREVQMRFDPDGLLQSNLRIGGVE